MASTSQHRINLSRQWEQLDADGNVQRKIELSNLGQIQLPVLARRKFNRPTGIDDKTVVRLRIEPMVGGIRLWLNELETPLCETDDSFWITKDIAPHLRPFNQMRIDISRPVPIEALSKGLNVSLCIDG